MQAALAGRHSPQTAADGSDYLTIIQLFLYAVTSVGPEVRPAPSPPSPRPNELGPLARRVRRRTAPQSRRSARNSALSRRADHESSRERQPRRVRRCRVKPTGSVGASISRKLCSVKLSAQLCPKSGRQRRCSAAFSVALSGAFFPLPAPGVFLSRADTIMAAPIETRRAAAIDSAI